MLTVAAAVVATAVTLALATDAAADVVPATDATVIDCATATLRL